MADFAFAEVFVFDEEEIVDLEWREVFEWLAGAANASASAARNTQAEIHQELRFAIIVDTPSFLVGETDYAANALQ